jgi:hypothetical protein
MVHQHVPVRDPGMCKGGCLAVMSMDKAKADSGNRKRAGDVSNNPVYQAIVVQKFGIEVCR